MPGPCGYWITNRLPDSPETGHFLRARARWGQNAGGAPSFDSKETADRVSEEIKRVRANQSTPMSKLAPDGMAEQFGGRIVNSSGT